MIDIKATIEKFGYSPEDLSLSSPKSIIYICPSCNKSCQCERRKYKQGHMCVHCTNSRKKVSKEELIKDIHRIIKQLGYQPSEDEFIKIAKHRAATLKKVFKKNTWKEILASLGYKVQRRRNDAYSYEEVAEDIKLVREKLKKIPRSKEYRDNGRFTINTVTRATKLSKWSDIVVKVFGIDEKEAAIFSHRKYRTTEFYYEKLRKLALELGHTPTKEEANHAGINSFQLEKRLETDWVGIIKSAGLDKAFFPGNAKPLHTSNEEILNDLKRVAKMLGKVPTEKEYKEYGNAYFRTYKKRFGGKWFEILELAGLSSPENPHKSQSKSQAASREDIIEDIRKIARLLEKVPTLDEYTKHGQFSNKTIRRLLHNWTEALQLAEPNKYINVSKNLTNEVTHIVELEKVEDTFVDFLKKESVDSIIEFFNKRKKL